jgi:shikimate dehydrogenase
MGGFEDSLPSLGVPEIRGEKVIVLGAGGAARAVVVALGRSNPSGIVIANRFPDETRGLVDSVSGMFPRVRFETVSLVDREVKMAAGGAILCVQATSLGLKPGDPLPVDPVCLPPECYLYDLVYGPGGTPWVRAARASGFRACDGKEMLVRQAARSFVIWVGRDAPVETMRAALDRGIGTDEG